jgi:hypothetical protein
MAYKFNTKVKEVAMYNENNQYYITDIVKGEKTNKRVSNFIWNIKKDTTVISANGVIEHVYDISGINVNGEKLPLLKVSASEYEAGGFEKQWGLKAIIKDKPLYKKHVYTFNKV